MAGNIKHGFRRGNANGRNGSSTPLKWFCSGCSRLHGGRVSRNRLLSDGLDYCDRKYYKIVGVYGENLNSLKAAA